MSTFASEKLGKEFDKLDEAGKQLVRLEFAKSMQESAGATGQAARESESLTNQLGNVKQLWTDVLAKLGEGLLPIVIGHIKQLADNLRNFDVQPIVNGVQTMITKFVAFKNAAVPVLTEMIAKAKAFGQSVKESWPQIAPILMGVGAAIATAVVALKTLQVIGIINGLFKAYKASAFAATVATKSLGAALMMNPIGLVVIAIVALVGIIVYLVNRFDWAKVALAATWAFIKTSFMAVMEWLKPYVMSAMTNVMAAFTAVKDYITSVMPMIIAVIKFAWEIIAPIFTNTLKVIMSVVKTAFSLILDIVSYALNNVTNVIKVAWEVISGIFKTAMQLLTGDFKGAWETVKETAVDAIKALGELFAEWVTGAFDVGKNFVMNILDGFKTAWAGLVDTVSSLWSSLKGLFTGDEINVGVNATTRYSGAVPSGLGVQASAYHGMSRVPYDGMVVKTHKNEAILSADEAAQWRAGKGGNFSIAKLADQIIVREDADIDRIAGVLYSKLKEAEELGA